MSKNMYLFSLIYDLNWPMNGTKEPRSAQVPKFIPTGEPLTVWKCHWAILLCDKNSQKASRYIAKHSRKISVFQSCIYGVAKFTCNSFYL